MRHLLIFTVLMVSSLANADEACVKAKQLELQWNADMPKKIDEFTEIIQIIVNCDTKVFSYKKRVLAEGSKFPSAMHERKQRQHTQLHCNKDGLASVSGWTAMDVIYDVNYEYMFTLTTSPEHCPS